MISLPNWYIQIRCSVNIICKLNIYVKNRENITVVMCHMIFCRPHLKHISGISNDNTSKYTDLNTRIWNIIGLENTDTQLLYVDSWYMLYFTISMIITTVSPTISHILLLQLLYWRFYSLYRLIDYYYLR